MAGNSDLAFQPIVERFAGEQLHCQEWDVSLVADLVDGDDVVVLDLTDRFRLAFETLGCGRILGVLGLHRLESDQPFQARIFRLEDDAHAAGAENLQHPVRPESAELVGSLGGTQEVERLAIGRARLVGLRRPGR